MKRFCTVILILLLLASCAAQSVPTQDTTALCEMYSADDADTSDIAVPFETGTETASELPTSTERAVGTTESAVSSPSQSMTDANKSSSAETEKTTQTTAAPRTTTAAGNTQKAQTTTARQSSTTTVAAAAPATTQIAAPDPVYSSEIRAVWITFYELTMEAPHNTEADFRALTREMVHNIRNAKMNTVFLHVRSHSDAFYRSNVFPFTSRISGTEGKDPGFDPLAIFCEYAAASGLSVHAWINPFRIGNASEMSSRSSKNPAKRILQDGDPDNDSQVVQVGSVLYYDPASPQVHDLIRGGVRELLENYRIDGVHIDDYFYPGTDASIDAKEYNAYKNSGGTLGLGDWRRSVVSAWVADLYRTVKSYGSEKIFSISPAVSVERNRSELYADVERWGRYDGYCDWMIPQLYVGFEHQTVPFPSAAAQWRALMRNPNVRLIFGLAAYKCGTRDGYAGSGANEWQKHSDILSRQLSYARSVSGFGGFALFSYSGVFGRNLSDNSNEEMKLFKAML
ncbi:MAG: family 10 glycosylhydrolase [Clostridia bacterium]|nr:family 10 glycosylhydrolase [Clostridia bacterium]